MYILKEFQCQVLAATPVIFNEFLIGVGLGWVAPTIRLLRDSADGNGPLSITDDQAAWISSTHSFGNFLAPLISTPLLNLFGRQGVLAIASVTFFISYTLIALVESITVIYFARLIFGIALGLHMLTAPLYLCENFKPSLRGFFGATSIACLYGGTFVEFGCANFFSYKLVAYTNATAAFVALASIFVSTETPDYLITKGRYDKALRNFLWLRGNKIATKEVTGDFEKLKQHIEGQREDKSTLMALLRTPIYRTSIAIVMVFGLLAGATGFDAVNCYVSITFSKGTLTPDEYTMLFGGLQFVTAVLGTFVIEKVNRRTILMISLAVSAIVHASTAALFYVRTMMAVPYFSWWTFGTITTFSMLFSSGILPIYATIMGELLPVNVRPIGTAVSTFGFSILSFLITKVFLFVSEMVGVYWNFVFYSLMNSTFVLFVYFIVPETRNKSLMEIQDAIKKRINSQS